MRATRFIVSAVALGTMTVAAAAQSTSSTGGSGVTFGVGGGLAQPVGTLNDGTKTGFDVHGMLGFNPASIPFGMRVDVGYNQFGFDGVDGNFKIVSGTANALLKIPATSIAPYVLGGLGIFNAKADAGGFGSSSETKFGINVGGGLQFNLSGMSTHLEAKYVNIFTSGDHAAYIPITFGVMFGGGSASGSRTRTR